MSTKKDKSVNIVGKIKEGINLISNFKPLDKDTDKEEIERLKKDKQNALHNPFYSIDLNTNKVKQNKQLTFIFDTKKKINTSNDSELQDLMYKEYTNKMDIFKSNINQYVAKQYTNFDELDNDIVNFNKIYDDLYYNGFSLNLNDLLDQDIRDNYIKEYADMIVALQLKGISDKLEDIKDFIDLDIDSTNMYIVVNPQYLKDLQKEIKDNINLNNGIDILGTLVKGLTELIVKEQTEVLNKHIKDNYNTYKKINSLYEDINKRIVCITNNFSDYYNQLSTPKNYDITKFNNSNEIISKIDPITKNILNGKNYEIGKLIKASNNYNKSYGAIFSIKTADLSNMDIIQELQQKGIRINHFGKKIIDDVDVLLEENKGNINNNDKLVALTPKMIARKVYNTEQPTKKQQNEIESYLRYLSNIYLFFVKDDTTAVNIEKLVQLKDNGLKYLQDEEGNVLNIGDTLDDNIILNASLGYSKKYNSIVYVFNNKSIFERVNQMINNDLGKQLLLSLKDKSDEIFKDYNKNVNNLIVGIRYLLFERVNQIKHSLENNKKINKEILLSNIYDEYDITTTKKKKDIRDSIKNTLNYWIDINYIKSYEFLDKEGNKIPKNSTKEIYKLYINA